MEIRSRINHEIVVHYSFPVPQIEDYINCDDVGMCAEDFEFSQSDTHVQGKKQ